MFSRVIGHWTVILDCDTEHLQHLYVQSHMHDNVSQYSLGWLVGRLIGVSFRVGPRNQVLYSSNSSPSPLSSVLVEGFQSCSLLPPLLLSLLSSHSSSPLDNNFIPTSLVPWIRPSVPLQLTSDTSHLVPRTVHLAPLGTRYSVLGARRSLNPHLFRKRDMFRYIRLGDRRSIHPYSLFEILQSQ